MDELDRYDGKKKWDGEKESGQVGCRPCRM